MQIAVTTLKQNYYIPLRLMSKEVYQKWFSVHAMQTADNGICYAQANFSITLQLSLTLAKWSWKLMLQSVRRRYRLFVDKNRLSWNVPGNIDVQPCAQLICRIPSFSVHRVIAETVSCNLGRIELECFSVTINSKSSVLTLPSVDHTGFASPLRPSVLSVSHEYQVVFIDRLLFVEPFCPLVDRRKILLSLSPPHIVYQKLELQIDVSQSVGRSRRKHLHVSTADTVPRL